ncbi:signal transduction histidine kinase [Sanguibacter keddieii DSM 10542]|uniref:histidine kinase n=1 Tax=Sanguibacter keddieii (strain ATCC 51767 / DSM 10542 / NCFB 3025 / ST-74) TaxID=446469 RepID=D1BK29_SANKS|nr:ATP-binding protein [Sanguibacter keddieii]ACZ22438.1 signal transduction histidine kinase [Sanguibacter keddieii DSM 10542]
MRPPLSAWRLARGRAPTLRTRLTVLYGAAFAVAGTVLVAILVVVAGRSLDNQPDDVVGIALGSSEILEASELDAFQQDALDVSPELATPEPPPSGDVAPLDQAPSSLEPSDDSAVALSALRTRVADLNDQARAQTMRTIILASVAALLVTLAVTVWFGWAMVSRVLAPLHRVTATARRVAGDSLSARIALDGRQDEIKDLADTFDEMLDRLDASFDGQRRFTANASHELRTPLTITRSVLEVALTDPECPEPTRELAEKLLAVNHRQGRLIEGLLALASADLVPPALGPVDLAVLATQVTAECEPGASASRVSVTVVTSPDEAEDVGDRGGPGGSAGLTPSTDGTHTCSPSGDRLVRGDHVLLDRLVRNLVDNAVRYNVEGGTVRVTVPCPHRLVVENTGPTVPEAQVHGLFEPFRRLRPDGTVADRAVRSAHQPGTGLGLSIVRSIVAAHSGSVTARPRASGGLVVSVYLPDGVQDGTGEAL